VNLHEKLARKQQLWIVAALLDRASAAMAPKRHAIEAKPLKEALQKLSDNSVDLGNITPEDLKHLGAEDFKSLYTKMTKQLKNQKEVFAEYSKMKSIPM
jgi:polyhydroxyalkanoate synthesis regulator phasin